MENKELEQVTYLMQNLLDNQNKIIQKLDANTSSKTVVTMSNEKLRDIVLQNFDKIVSNQQKIFNNVSKKTNVDKTTTNNYHNEVTNQYTFLDSAIFKRYQNWLRVVLVILFFAPSLYSIYSSNRIQKEYKQYKRFYEYVKALQKSQNQE